MPIIHMRHILAYIIRVYQLTLSPDHGLFRSRYPHGFCRYYPSCSEYTRLSILEFGIFRGGWYGVVRILRCNPFVKPRIDNIPNA